MGDFLPSDLACEERPWKSSSPLADFLKLAGVRVACGSGAFVLKDLLPGYESICHVASILLVRPCHVPVYLSSTDPSVPDRVRQFANLSLTGSSLSLYSNKVFTRFLGRF
jgi:hypothetical protein